MSNHPHRQNHRPSSEIVSQLLQRLPFKESHLILFIALLTLGGYTIFLTNDLFPGGDNARYLILAKSLLTGNGYRNIGLLTAPSHTLAPPGFPLLLAPVILTFDTNIVAAKTLVALFGTLSILVVYTLFKRKYNSLYATGIAALYGITPVVFMYARRVYSDLPFIVVSLLAFMSVEQYATKQSQVNKALLAAALLTAASLYLRPIALVLVLTAVLWLLIENKVLKASLLIALVTVLIAPWYYWVSRVSDTTTPGHLSMFLSQNGPVELLQLMLSNLMSYGKLFTENFWYLTTKALEHLNFLSGSLSYLSYCSIVLVIILVLAGLFDCWREGIGFAEFYVGVYIMVLLSYTFVIDRFIIPILPFIIHYYVRGVTVLTNGITQRVNTRPYVASWLKFLLILFVVLSNIVHIIARLYQEQHFSTFYPTVASNYDVARWAGTHLEPTAVVMTDYPDFFYIYADLQAVDPRKDDPGLIDNTIKFVVAEAAQETTLWQWLQRNEESIAFHSLYCSDTPRVCLYEIHKPTNGDIP